MFRIALTALAIYFIWRLIRWVFAGSQRNTAAKDATGELGPAEMVACAGCGTFVVSGEAVNRGNSTYCSEECADKPDPGC